ncbi:endoplasmic reticulum membrane sensor NFE2L1-like isoform X2 [Mastacembelus armatus]|uniref:endoplasmic reticulum membrane sensor NFE2L1-like isoform X2 n=1 Tax=Mastacembelus armatus TaxID=205130 RepID=UPI000E45AD21|nr:endoplasmic reticulum membrane sensor NFE2L1-like isoform X2 [Mastacembelus armatus]
MLYLKKYFMEGLIQMAILLSLCGMRVDVGLDLPPSWHEMILGPTSALTQTQFHNLRNRLEDGHGLHPKSVDVDSFFTTRRLLGWVRSLDRLEVPHAQLETWLVQREPEPLPLAYPNQPSPLERAPTGVEREQTGQPVEPRARRGTMQDEEEADDKETCVSLEECLRLLEETLPFTADQQLSDIDGSRGDMGPDLLGTEPLLSPIIPTDSPSSNLELPWQDLFALMEPENTHVDRTTSFNPALDSRASETLWGDESEALYQVCNSVDSCITEVDQEDCLMDIPLQHDVEDETDSDSGLSLDFSYNPASPCASEASSYSSSSSSSSNSSSSWVSSMGSPFSKDDDAEKELVGSDMEVEVTIKEEQEEEEMGAVGGGYPEDVKKLLPNYYENHKMLKGFSWLEHIDHDHTYNQPWSSASSPSLGKSPTKRTKSSLRHYNARPYHSASSRHISVTEMWSRDERRARALRIPFSNELIVNLPVEEFNDLLINYQLSEEQLTLIRDIRRRGKNKIAAQNCRKRKMNVLLGLEDDVSDLRHHHSQLFREKQEALRNLQEMKRRLSMLYQHVFSRLRDEDGRPLDTTEYVLHFGPNGCVTVASRQGELRPLTAQNSKKPKDKKK